MGLLKFLFKFGIFCAFWGLIVGVGLFIYAYATYGKDLPTVDFMKDYSPPTVSRVHAADGQLIAEHATERRLFVPIEAIPEHVKGAFLSAEDKDFCYKKRIIPYKAELEIWYLNNKSFSLDIALILMTLWVIPNPDSQLLYKLYPSIPRNDIMQSLGYMG